MFTVTPVACSLTLIGLPREQRARMGRRLRPARAIRRTQLAGVLQCLQDLQAEVFMRATNSTVISMRLPAESGKRLKRMANRHGWTASDASARLVEEGLRRAEFAFIDFRDSP